MASQWVSNGMGLGASRVAEAQGERLVQHREGWLDHYHFGKDNTYGVVSFQNNIRLR